jgi:hypothetical protein
MTDISTVPFEERSFGAEAAMAVLGLCKTTYFALVASGELETYKAGRLRMTTGRAINAYREKRTRETKEASSSTP